MVIEKSNNEIILRIPADFDSLGIQRILNYLRYKEKIKNSKATEEIAQKLSNESKKTWWEENKDNFIK